MIFFNKRKVKIEGAFLKKKIMEIVDMLANS